MPLEESEVDPTAILDHPAARAVSVDPLRLGPGARIRSAQGTRLEDGAFLAPGVVTANDRRPVPAQTAPAEGLSVVVPAYNEAGNLESIARYLAAELDQLVPDFEVILVNDGSHDGTGVIADHLAAEDERIRVVHHPFNIGFGAAQKSGFREARKDWVAVVPADHQFDARDLGRLWARRREADLVGSRRVPRRDPLPRRLVSALYNTAMRALYRLPLRDINWVKLWRRALFDRISIESPGFGVDAEIVAKAVALGYRVAEVDVPHHPRTWGTPTGIRLATLWRTGRELLRIGPMLRRMRHEAGSPRDRTAAAVAPPRE